VDFLPTILCILWRLVRFLARGPTFLIFDLFIRSLPSLRELTPERDREPAPMPWPENTTGPETTSACATFYGRAFDSVPFELAPYRSLRESLSCHRAHTGRFCIMDFSQQVGSELTNQFHSPVSFGFHRRMPVLNPVVCFLDVRDETLDGERLIEAVTTAAEFFFEIPEFKNAG